MMLVDLEVPGAADPEMLRATLTRWAQETRFAMAIDVPGVRFHDARGVVITESMAAILRALVAVSRG